MKASHRARLRLEKLDTRNVPSTFYVSPSGLDTNAGSNAAPWKTLQFAANKVAAGDTVVVRAGTYTGFQITTDGTAANRIVFQADPGVLINAKNAGQSAFSGVINLEGADFVTIDGFTVKLAVYGDVRSNIRSVENTGAVIRNNTLDDASWWGVLTGNSANLLVEGNTITDTKIQHGVYIANSADNPVVRGNRIENSRGAGIQINADKDLPGDGIISNALVENNVLLNNCAGESSSLNLNGNEDGVFRNNLIASQFRNGVALYQDNQTTGSKRNKLYGNTVIGSAFYGISISGAGSTDNQVFDNILFSQGWASNFRGGLGVENISGLASDYNVLIGRVNRDPSNTESPAETSTQWKARGFDTNSVFLEDKYGTPQAALAALFVTPPSYPLFSPQTGDYHLKAGSPAIDIGTKTDSVIDRDGDARPQGGGFDIGSDEFATGTPPNAPPTISDVADQKTANGTAAGPVTFTVGDAETPAASLTVSAASSNTALVPNGNVTLGGSGANRTVTVSPVAGQSGTATVTLTVTDAGGATAKDTFVLTVAAPPNAPPTISDVTDQKTANGTAAGPFAFTVGDAETPAANLTVTAASSNTTLVPNGNVTVGGSGANRTVTVSPVAGQSGTATITLTVADGNGGTATDTFVLTVAAPPNAPPTISDVTDRTSDGTVIGPVAFTVGDAETPAGNLTVTAVSSNPALVPNTSIALGGSGAARTIALTPVAGQSGTTTITITVTDPSGATATDTFDVIVSPPPPPPVNRPPTIIDVANQSSAGGPVGPVGFTVDDADTPAAGLVVTARSSNPALVPDGNIAVGGSGADRTVTVTPVAGQAGTATITLTVTDPSGATATDSFDVVVTLVPQPNTPPATPPSPPEVPPVAPPATPPTPPDAPPNTPPAGGTTPVAPVPNTPVVPATPDVGGGPVRTQLGFREFAAGSDAGTGTAVTLYSADRSVRFTGSPFPGFTGGVRTAAADFNADGVADLVVGTGPGGPTRVRVLDGKDQRELFAVAPFEAAFVGGVYVAAGDTNGDGMPELVITPDEGGGPRVRVFDGNGFTLLADFFGIDDPNFRGGARASVGDINGDRAGELVVSAGFLGGPRVAGFDGKSLGTGPVKVFADFFAFEQTLRNGTFVAAGDLDGDGFAELVVGGGPGGGPRVTAFGGKALLRNEYDVRADFFGGDPNSRGGIRVAVKDLDGDARADVVVGSGAGAGNRVTGYLGKDVGPAGAPAAAFDLDAFPGFSGGVYVG